MPLVNATPLLAQARAGGYALAAFNLDTVALVRPLIRAAVEEQAPVIIQAGPVGLRAAGLEALAAVVRVEANAARVPIGLHLDHGTDLEEVAACLAAGFTSVMLDGSLLAPDEKLRLTRQAVAVARARSAGVEAELGPIAGAEEGITVAAAAARMTDPDEARAFVDRTQVDALAVSVGNVHTPPPAPVELDLDRLRQIAARVHVPLVLHGGSSVTEASLVRAVRLGVAKVNIAHVINRAFVGGARQALGAGASRPSQVLAEAEEAVVTAARERIRLLGAAGTAGWAYRSASSRSASRCCLSEGC